MNQTDAIRRSEEISGALFDGAIAPMGARFREDGRAPFFRLGPDAAVITYFSTPSTRVLSVDDFKINQGGSAEGVITALIQYWRTTGDDEFAALGPQLIQIAAALQSENEDATGEISPLCYTLF